MAVALYRNSFADAERSREIGKWRESRMGQKPIPVDIHNFIAQGGQALNGNQFRLKTTEIHFPSDGTEEHPEPFLPAVKEVQTALPRTGKDIMQMIRHYCDGILPDPFGKTDCRGGNTIAQFLRRSE